MFINIQQLVSSHKAATTAWLALVCATGIGLLFGHSAQAGAQLATAGVIITAFVKIWIISFQFMELKQAPRWLRHMFEAWIVVITTVLLGICLQ